MLVINVQLTIDPAKRADFVAAAVAMQRASQVEAGCHHYVFAADLEDEAVFHIAEKWDDQAALEAHFATAHMATFQKAIAGSVTGSKAFKYVVASEGPVF